MTIGVWRDDWEWTPGRLAEDLDDARLLRQALGSIRTVHWSAPAYHSTRPVYPDGRSTTFTFQLKYITKPFRPLERRTAARTAKSQNPLRPGAGAEFARYILRGRRGDTPAADLAHDAEGPVIVGSLEAQDAARYFRDAEEREDGGHRYQARVVVELPVELPSARHRQIMAELGERLFGHAEIPWLGVVHTAPAHGDHRNVHGHLVAGDRPALQHPDGLWMFDRYKRRDLRGPAWIASSRQAFAAIVNRHFGEESAARVAQGLPPIERRFDPRSYADAGVAKKPCEHLGRHRSALERAGIPTAAGLRNAAREVDHVVRAAEERHRVHSEKIAATDAELARLTARYGIARRAATVSLRVALMAATEACERLRATEQQRHALALATARGAARSDRPQRCATWARQRLAGQHRPERAERLRAIIAEAEEAGRRLHDPAVAEIPARLEAMTAQWAAARRHTTEPLAELHALLGRAEAVLETEDDLCDALTTPVPLYDDVSDARDADSTLDGAFARALRDAGRTLDRDDLTPALLVTETRAEAGLAMELRMVPIGHLAKLDEVELSGHDALAHTLQRSTPPLIHRDELSVKFLRDDLVPDGPAEPVQAIVAVEAELTRRLQPSDPGLSELLDVPLTARPEFPDRFTDLSALTPDEPQDGQSADAKSHPRNQEILDALRDVLAAEPGARTRKHKQAWTVLEENKRRDRALERNRSSGGNLHEHFAKDRDERAIGRPTDHGAARGDLGSASGVTDSAGPPSDASRHAADVARDNGCAAGQRPGGGRHAPNPERGDGSPRQNSTAGAAPDLSTATEATAPWSRAQARLKAFAEKAGWQHPAPGWACCGKMLIDITPDGAFRAGGKREATLPAAVISAYRVRGKAPPPEVMEAARQAMITPWPPAAPVAVGGLPRSKRSGVPGGTEQPVTKADDPQPAGGVPAMPSADHESAGASACIRLLAFAALAGWKVHPPYLVSDGAVAIGVCHDGGFLAGGQAVPSLADAVSNAHRAKGKPAPERAMRVAQLVMSRPLLEGRGAVPALALRPLPPPAPAPTPPTTPPAPSTRRGRRKEEKGNQR